MEHIEVIVKIIEAEQAAQKVADDALAQKQNLASSLTEKKQNLHDQFVERAKRRVELVRQQDQEEAEENLAQLEKQMVTSREQLQRSYQENASTWTEALFSYVTQSSVEGE